MKILLPKFAHDWDNPHLQVFIAFMYRIGLKNGFRQEYTLYPQDVRLICQQYFIIPYYPFEKYEDYWHHFKFGNINQWTWSFVWKREPHSADWIEIEDPRAREVWAYLMGREAKSELVEDKYRGYNEPRYKSLLNARDIKQFRYTEDHKNNDE